MYGRELHPKSNKLGHLTTVFTKRWSVDRTMDLQGTLHHCAKFSYSVLLDKCTLIESFNRNCFKDVVKSMSPETLYRLSTSEVSNCKKRGPQDRKYKAGISFCYRLALFLVSTEGGNLTVYIETF